MLTKLASFLANCNEASSSIEFGELCIRFNGNRCKKPRRLGDLPGEV